MKKLLVVLVACLFIFLWADISFGSGCRSRPAAVVQYSPAVYTPVVAAQVYQQVVAVPVVVQDYYYSVQDYYRDRLLVDAVAGRVMQLMQQQAPPPSVLPPQKQVMPPAKANSSFPKLEAIVVNKCAKCHSGDAKKGGGFSLDDLASIPQAKRESALWRVYDSDAGEDAMPRGGPPLSDEEVAEFAAWIRSGRQAKK